MSRQQQRRMSSPKVMSPRGFANAFPAVSSSAGDLKYQALTSSTANNRWGLRPNNSKHDAVLDTLSEDGSEDGSHQRKRGFVRRNIRGLFHHHADDESNDEPSAASSQTEKREPVSQMDFSEFNLTQVALSLQMTLKPRTRSAIDKVRHFNKVVLGSEIVEALCKAGYASTTAEAHLIGIILLRGGYLTHVSRVSHFKRIIQREPRFKTGSTFYRLNSPSSSPDTTIRTINALRPFILHVHVNGARNLPTLSRGMMTAPTASSAKPSPFLKVLLGESESVSNIKTRTCNPMWDIDWLFAARSGDVVQVMLYNKTTKVVGGNLLLGRVAIAIDQLLEDQEPLEEQLMDDEPATTALEGPQNKTSLATVAAAAAAAAASVGGGSPRSAQSWWELARFRGGNTPENKANRKERGKRGSMDRFDHCRWYSLRDMHGRLCEGEVLLSLSLLNRSAYDSATGMGISKVFEKAKRRLTAMSSSENAGSETGAKKNHKRMSFNRLASSRLKRKTSSSSSQSQGSTRSGFNILRRKKVAIVPMVQAQVSPLRRLSNSISGGVRKKLFIRTDSDETDSGEAGGDGFDDDAEARDRALASNSLTPNTKFNIKRWRNRSVESKLSSYLDVQRVLDCTDASVKRTSGLVRAYYTIQAVQRTFMVPRSLKSRSPTAHTPTRPLQRRFISFALPEVTSNEKSRALPKRRKSKNKNSLGTHHLLSAATQTEEGVDKCVANVNALNRGATVVQVQEVQTVLLDNETTLVVEAVQLFGSSSREVVTVHFLLTDRAPPLYGCEVCVSTDSEIPNANFYTELVQRAHQLVLQNRISSGKGSSHHTNRGRVAGAVATAAAAAKTAAFGAVASAAHGASDSVQRVEEVALCTPRCKMLVVEQPACDSQEMRKALFQSAVFLNALRDTGHVEPWVEEWKASRVGSTRRQDVATLLENAGRAEHKTSDNAEARFKLFLGFGAVALLFLALGTAQDWIPALLRCLYALTFGWLF